MLSDLYNEEKIIRVGMVNAVTKASKEARKAGLKTGLKTGREEERTMLLQLLQENNMISPEQLVELQNLLAACGRCTRHRQTRSSFESAACLAGTREKHSRTFSHPCS